VPGRQPFAPCYGLSDSAMWELLKEIFALAAIVAAILAVGWSTGPIDQPLLTGRTCAEIAERLVAQKDHILTPAEETDVANCTEP
jgi:hypothetical protein